MKIREFAWLADENISPAVIAFLRDEGVNIVPSVDVLSPGSSDFQVLQSALQQHRVVLTHDRDFGTLAIRKGQPYVGIIFCRPGHIDSGLTIKALRTVLYLSLDLTEPFILVVDRSGDEVRVRLRQSAN